MKPYGIKPLKYSWSNENPAILFDGKQAVISTPSIISTFVLVKKFDFCVIEVSGLVCFCMRKYILLTYFINNIL